MNLQTSGRGNTGGQACAISGDGQRVLMRSPSSNLVTGDNNFDDDLFLKDLATGTVTQVNTDATGAPSSIALNGCATA